MPAARFPTTEIVPSPTLALIVVGWAHVVAAAAGAATTRPVGSVSVKPHPLFAASSLVFVIVKVSCDGAPTLSTSGLKDLSSWGVASRTSTLSNDASLPSSLVWPFLILMPSAEPLNSVALLPAKLPALKGSGGLVPNVGGSKVFELLSVQGSIGVVNVGVSSDPLRR